MKRRRNLFVLVLVLIVSLALVVGCSTRSAGEGQGSDQAGGESEGGALDEIDLSGASDQAGEEGALDEIDLRTFVDCPDEPTLFNLEVVYTMTAEDDKGKYTERIKSEEGANVIPFVISKDGVLSASDVLPYVIEGKSGSCTISGWGDISVHVTGTCSGDTASLSIVEEFEFYTRSTECPGKAPITYTDSAFPAPSIDWDFKLTKNGDKAGTTVNLAQFKAEYSWTLKLVGPVGEGADLEPEPLTE